jgi:hypothetical protein
MIVITDDDPEPSQPGGSSDANKLTSEHVRVSKTTASSIPAIGPSIKDQRANRPRLRPRRSSETLGTRKLSWDGNDSLVAKSIPSPREPKKPGTSDSSSAISQLGEFYHAGALARASGSLNAARTGTEATEELIMGSKSSENRASLAVRILTIRSDTSVSSSPQRLWSMTESMAGVVPVPYPRRRRIGLPPITKS